ncbi:MAG: VanZ family protein [bacterium]
MDYGKVLHNQKIEKFLPLILWCVLIFIGSSLPSASASKNPLIDFIVHKSVHIVEYFVLFLFAYKAFNKKFLASFIFVIFYSLSDEFHQRFVPGRNGRIKDSFVDLTGALLGALVIWKFLQILPHKLRNWLLK